MIRFTRSLAAAALSLGTAGTMLACPPGGHCSSSYTPSYAPPVIYYVPQPAPMQPQPIQPTQPTQPTTQPTQPTTQPTQPQPTTQGTGQGGMQTPFGQPSQSQSQSQKGTAQNGRQGNATKPQNESPFSQTQTTQRGTIQQNGQQKSSSFSGSAGSTFAGSRDTREYMRKDGVSVFDNTRKPIQQNTQQSAPR